MMYFCVITEQYVWIMFVFGYVVLQTLSNYNSTYNRLKLHITLFITLDD